MKRSCSLLASAWLLCFAAGALADVDRSRPNILVIYADDLGYGDVQCYNRDRGKIPTPHIDALAAEGMRFTDAHSSSGVCSPSRYTLLTGRYHWRTRLQSGIVGLWKAPLIAPNRLTIGGLAEQHGYRTACIGKWHLGWDWPISPEHKKLFAAPQEERRRGFRRASNRVAGGLFSADCRWTINTWFRRILWHGRSQLAAVLLH